MATKEPEYTNEETRDEILGALEEQQENEVSFNNSSPEELTKARDTVASEEQPDPEAPDLRQTFTVSFRGHEFEFYELGRELIQSLKMAGVDDEGEIDATALGDYIYLLLGEKSVNDACDADYWAQYDLAASGDTQGLDDLFTQLIDESQDIPDNAEEMAEEFREERRGDSSS